jgi:hypothetical protein
MLTIALFMQLDSMILCYIIVSLEFDILWYLLYVVAFDGARFRMSSQHNI